MFVQGFVKVAVAGISGGVAGKFARGAQRFANQRTRAELGPASPELAKAYAKRILTDQRSTLRNNFFDQQLRGMHARADVMRAHGLSKGTFVGGHLVEANNPAAARATQTSKQAPQASKQAPQAPKQDTAYPEFRGNQKKVTQPQNIPANQKVVRAPVGTSQQQPNGSFRFTGMFSGLNSARQQAQQTPGASWSARNFGLQNRNDARLMGSNAPAPAAPAGFAAPAAQYPKMTANQNQISTRPSYPGPKVVQAPQPQQAAPPPPQQAAPAQKAAPAGKQLSVIEQRRQGKNVPGLGTFDSKRGWV